MIVAVVVTYHPGSLSDLLGELGWQCEACVVVDNGSTRSELRQIEAECHAAGAQLIELGTNIGIAAAQNRGITIARSLGAREILLCDHDSIPSPTMVAQLHAALHEDPRIAAVGPLATESREGADELIYMDRGWAPKRATKEELTSERLDVPFLIASGCLIRVEALDAVGDMREDFFIDHVDLEWGVRARAHGWRLVAVPSARLEHSLGDSVVKLPGRDQPIHVHAPIRNYYLMRNTVALVRGSELPWRWRVRYAYWAAKYAAFNSFAVGDGPERRALLARGVRDGLRGRMGKYRG